MFRIVIDTNVLVSALIARGKPRRLLGEVIDKRLMLVTSNELLEELIGVVKRPKFKMSDDEINRFVGAVIRTGKMIEVISDFNVIMEDPADNMILNTAYDGRADYIVSGDEHLLVLRDFKGIKIVTVAEILKYVL